MPEFRLRVGTVTLHARCDEALAPQATAMLSTLAGFADQGPGLADGVTVQFGWALLRLRAAGEELAVCEPDYDGNAPAEFRDEVTCTLAVTLRQASLVQRCGAEPVAVRFDDRVILKRGCLTEPRIYAQRSAPTPGDSGWYVGPVGGPRTPPTADELEARRVYHLLQLRPALLDLLALPPDYLAVLNGEAVQAVMDPQGRNVWR